MVVRCGAAISMFSSFILEAVSYLDVSGTMAIERSFEAARIRSLLVLERELHLHVMIMMVSSSQADV